MEARKRKDSQYWTSVLDAIPAGLSIHSADGVVLSVNKRLGQIYQKAPEAFLGQSCTDLFHQQSQQCPHENVLRSMSQAEVASVFGRKTYQVIFSPVADSRGGACGFTRMMIEPAGLPLAKALLKPERAGTLEQMISGIAHDVGTPLGIISGYSEYLLMRSKEGEAGHKELSTILQQTRRIADSIKQMLDLVRPSSGRVDAIGLKGFLTELVELMGHHLRKAGVKASVSCCSSPPLIYGDAPKLRRAFFNLVIDAIEQVGQGGEIELILREVGGRPDLANVLLAATANSGPAPDFQESVAGVLKDGGDLIDPALSRTLEILEGFRAEIEPVDLGDRRAGLSINIPVRPPESGAAYLPR
jgi:signal transduction histidine kinase